MMEERITNTFWKDGSKVVLFPLKDEGKTENMLSEREFVKERKETIFHSALIVQNSEESDIKHIKSNTNKSFDMNDPSLLPYFQGVEVWQT
jgi:hypothetical protein